MGEKLAKGRWQQIALKGVVLDWRKVTSSVLQDSVLGLILLNIFSNDLDSRSGNVLKRTASDTKED